MKILEPEFIRQDKRGVLLQLSTGDWKQCNILKIKKGYVFGNHYHRIKTELFYVLKGKIHLTIKKKSYKTYTRICADNDCFLVEPYENHILEAKEDTVLVELLSHPYSKEDIYSD